VLFERYGAPDLLIVDLRLREEEHGVDLAKRLQKKYSDFPVLVLTGETDTDSLIKTNSAGYELLQKPISAEILFETLYKSMSITNMT
jgi:FixJ family two-component response regulator